MVLLLAFIVWDRRRIANGKLPAFSPDDLPLRSNSRILGYTGIALMCGIMAVSEFVNPRLPPFTGRWALAYELAYTVGPYGLFIYWAVLAAAFGLAAIIFWHTAGRSL